MRPGDNIERRALHDRYGGNRQRGISPSTTTPHVLIFSAGTSGEQHGYMDHWDEDGVFHYYGEGQEGDQVFAGGNAAILNHRRDGRTLRVFDGARGQVRYRGAFELDMLPFYRAETRATRGPDRVALVFRLRPLANETELATNDLRVEPADLEYAVDRQISKQLVGEVYGEYGLMDPEPIPVVRHSQKGVTCYVGHMPAWMCRQVTFADSFPPDEANGRLGYQRQANHKRAKAFADYLTHTDSGFMTPILLNARQPVDFRAESDGDVGEIVMGDGQQFAKIDGQHRGLGVEDYLGDDDFPVPFMLFEQLDTDLDVIHE